MYLQYKGLNLITRIPKSELVQNASRYAYKPYSNENGSDVNSLKSKIIESKGCIESANPIIFKYEFRRGEAIATIDWNLIRMSASQAFLTIELSANYDFKKIVHLHILDVKDYFNFVPARNIYGRGKTEIGVLKVIKACSESELTNLEKREHILEIGEEINKENHFVVTTNADGATQLAQSSTLNIPFSENKDIRIFIDFGKSGISKQLSYTFSFKLNGERITFGSKPVTIDPYIPHLTKRIELHKNIDDSIPKQNLQKEPKEVGVLYVNSDALSGELSIDAILGTDSDVVTIGKEKNNRGNTIVSNESEREYPLILDGSKLTQLPDSDIVIKLLNKGIEIDKVILTKRAFEESDENKVLLSAPVFAKFNKENRQYLLYKGNEKEIEIPLSIITGEKIPNVKLSIYPANCNYLDITSDRQLIQVSKKVYNVKVHIHPKTVFPPQKVTLCASAPYFRDAMFDFYVECKEKKTPSLSIVFTPNKIINDKVIIYRSCEEKIGELSIQIPIKKDEKKSQDHYLLVNLDRDLHLIGNLPFIKLIQQGQGPKELSLGDSAFYDVIANPTDAIGLGDYSLDFECLNNKSNSTILLIKEKKPEGLPELKFVAESKIVYPVDKAIIKVGSISITLPQQTRGCYKRVNGCIMFKAGNNFFFDKGGNANSSPCLNSSVDVFFDAYNYFNHIANLNEEIVEVPLSLLYKDDNVNTENIDIDVQDGTFDILQYDAQPIFKAFFVVNARKKKIELNFIERQATIALDDIVKYSEKKKTLPPGEKYSIVFSNVQRISIPSNKIDINAICSDSDFVAIGGEKSFSLKNGDDDRICPVKIVWSNLNGSYDGFGITFNINNQEYAIHVKCSIFEDITSDWTSLDLGTSAIVMAKMSRNEMNRTEINTIHLTDSNESLEPHKDMVSSTIALFSEGGSQAHRVILSPERKTYNRASAILPPIKFIVGQDKIPFVDVYAKRGINKLYSDFLKETLIYDLKPQQLLESIYENIFSKMGENGINDTKKLILTYPSTYTIEQRDSLRKLILAKFKNIQPQNLHFVAESDAVLAHYLYSKRISNGGDPLKNNENILIYDMGAGTLDISYVHITINNDNEVIATIEKRIGIPVAGNYLDYCIFKYLEPKLADDALKDLQQLKRDIQDLKSELRDTKEIVENIAFKEINSSNSINLEKEESTKEQVTYHDIIESDFIQNDFLKSCTEQVFELLLGKEWNKKDVTFVYSGRGCLFTPLIEHIKKISSNKWMPQPIADTTEDMKLCAAKGAIKYVQVFSQNAQQPFKIVSFKHYSSFGLVYCSFGEDGRTETHKCDIFKSPEEFEGALEESAESSVNVLPSIDIRPTGQMFVVQSYLPKERIAESFNRRMKEKPDPDSDECFISTIYSVYREDLGIEDSDLSSARVEFNIDDSKDTISCVIQDQPLNECKFSESIEKNRYYIKSMWPFNNDLINL